MASIPPSYYHASAVIPIANHSDFFNTHVRFHQQSGQSLWNVVGDSNTGEDDCQHCEQSDSSGKDRVFRNLGCW